MLNLIFNSQLKIKKDNKKKGIEEEKKHSRTSRYGHLSNTDSFQCPDKILIYFL